MLKRFSYNAGDRKFSMGATAGFSAPSDAILADLTKLAPPAAVRLQNCTMAETGHRVAVAPNEMIAPQIRALTSAYGRLRAGPADLRG